jgi:GH35 family endo-1,4-beta-xylanase
VAAMPPHPLRWFGPWFGGVVVFLAGAGCAAPPEPSVAYAEPERMAPPPPPGPPPGAIDGALLAARSTGHAEGRVWVLDGDGYVGTYLRLDAPATVTLTLRAGGRGAPGCPRAAVVVGDARTPLEVGPDPQDYRATFALPAGTHFARVDSFAAACHGALAVTLLAVTGAHVSNETSDANALAAADTYASTGRRGRARVRIDGAAPGAPVRIHLRRHAFQLGVNAPGTFNRYLIEGAPADSEAGRWQRFVLAHFNTLVPSNAGKWVYNEGVRDFVTMEYPDLILRYAARHDLGARMHTMLWDTEQQPDWVQALLGRAAAGDAAAKEDLVRAVRRRIDYYVRDRGDGYQAVDVINESAHHPRWFDVLGPGGVADVFNRVAAAAPVRGCLNEYNVLQNSTELPGGKEGASDPYANWYRRQVEAVRAKGGAVGGIGVQYYAIAGHKLPSVHSPGRIALVLNNLTATGLPVTLTEFGVQKGASRADAARILGETMRMAYGTPGVDGFVMFGFWQSSIWDMAPEAVLVDKDWRETEAGATYDRLMAAWGTDIRAPVGPDGTVELVGAFGDYEVEGGGKTGLFKLTKGTSEYVVALK